MTLAMDAKARQRRQWGEAAAAWDRRFDWYSRAFGPMFDWCADAVHASEGTRLLDVSCGAGQPLLALAARVGARGRVVAVDLAPEMVEAARRQSAAWPNVELREMDAEALDFPDASFDAVTCACGLMFFPDASRAVAEMRRVLRRGGRLAVVVWDEPPLSTFFTVAGGAVARFFPPSPPDPDAPGAFRFSRAGSLEAVLRSGGFERLAVERLTIAIDLPSRDEYWSVFTEMAAGIGARIAQLSEPERRQLRAAVDEGLAPYSNGGGVRLAVAPLCAAATR